MIIAFKFPNYLSIILYIKGYQQSNNSSYTWEAKSELLLEIEQLNPYGYTETYLQFDLPVWSVSIYLFTVKLSQIHLLSHVLVSKFMYEPYDCSEGL